MKRVHDREQTADSRPRAVSAIVRDMVPTFVLAARLAITVATSSTLVTPALATAAAAEADAVWRPAGVDIEWSIGDRPGWAPEPPMLYVVFADHCIGERGGGLSLASIDFINGEPMRRIVVCANEVTAVAASAELVPRVMGRAIAHEIGHYLFGREHMPAGLMRARHSFAEFCAPDGSPFALVLPRRSVARTLPSR
jgi:hypothetical protein